MSVPTPSQQPTPQTAKPDNQIIWKCQGCGVVGPQVHWDRLSKPLCDDCQQALMAQLARQEAQP